MYFLVQYSVPLFLMKKIKNESNHHLHLAEKHEKAF